MNKFQPRYCFNSEAIFSVYWLKVAAVPNKVKSTAAVVAFKVIDFMVFLPNNIIYRRLRELFTALETYSAKNYVIGSILFLLVWFIR